MNNNNVASLYSKSCRKIVFFVFSRFLSRNFTKTIARMFLKMSRTILSFISGCSVEEKRRKAKKANAVLLTNGWTFNWQSSKLFALKSRETATEQIIYIHMFTYFLKNFWVTFRPSERLSSQIKRRYSVYIPVWTTAILEMFWGPSSKLLVQLCFPPALWLVEIRSWNYYENNRTRQIISLIKSKNLLF